jgi:peptidoglycan/xylan/chitin deacetylase (PgdA/CDA1 family)
MKRIIGWISVGCLVLGGVGFGWKTLRGGKSSGYTVRAKDIYHFPDISGPAGKSNLPHVNRTNWEKYQSGSHSRLAVLLTDTNSPWLGLVHALKTIGIPFVLTRDYRQAIKHRVVLVYPLISGKVLDAAALRALAQFPQQGGTIIGVNVHGGLQETFGFAEAVESGTRREIRFGEASTAFGFTEAKERAISLGRGAKNAAGESTAAIGTLGYRNTSEPPIAEFDDGTAAITQRRIGAGFAYALGFDPGFLALKSYGNRDDEIGRHYVNQYEPTLDVLLRLLRQIYRQAARSNVTIETVPFNRALTVLLTHDVDFAGSVQNAVAYAEFEQSQNIKATYFVQTKYIRDYNDDIFLTQETMPALRRLAEMGMEIGSHTVCHSLMFAKMPPGTGDERYPDYTPFVQDRTTVFNASLLGELRVSKFLLERLTGVQVKSFRPGELSNPFLLPDALEATGYSYGSSVTANDSFTHLPFQLNYGRGYEAESPIFEFPVTIEDEEQPELGSRLNEGIALARQVSRSGGVVNVLIHPNILGHKLEFERGFVAAFKDSAWFGTIGEFGDWWAARNDVILDVETRGKSLIIKLQIPREMAGLTLRLPAQSKFMKSTPANESIQQSGDALVIGKAVGALQLTLQ